MAASHFFVGLAAGAALLTLPVLAFTPGLDVPGHIEAWIEGPPKAANSGISNELVTRPLRGYVAGSTAANGRTGVDAASGAADSAPVAPPPTLAPAARPTAVLPTPQPTPVQIAPRGLLTGVIRGGGQPVYVRHAAGVDSPTDPVLADGSPVLVSAGPGLRVGQDQWRGVRGLSGVVGWVLAWQVQVDGEPPVAPPEGVQQQPASLVVGHAAPTASSAAAQAGQTTSSAVAQAGQTASSVVAQAGQTPGTVVPQSGQTASSIVAQAAQAGSYHVRIANTGGVGVVLRRSPNNADRTTEGLADGATVSVVESQGSDWVHVHADNGLDGWVPARYVTPSN